MISLFFDVSAQGGGVPRAGLVWLLNAGNFPIQVLDIIVLIFDKGHEALVARGERGVFQHQLLQDVFFVGCGSSQVVEIAFEGFYIATVFLELISEGEMIGFLVGG